MLFYSESKLIFQIVVGGQYRIVEFSDSNVESRSCVFRTDNKDVIKAIRNHKFYRKGKIREQEEPKEPKKQVKKPVDEGMKEFSSYSHLKAYLRTAYKNDPAVKKIKTPEDVAKYAQGIGLSYRFVEV